MYHNLDEVIKYKENDYNKSNLRDDYFPRGKYMEQEITNVERALSLRFHTTFRNLLHKVNLDTIGFHNLYFGGGIRYTKYLTQVNESIPKIENTLYVQIGSTDGYLVLMNNETGEIYVFDSGNAGPIQKVASEIEEFICRAAFITSRDFDPNEIGNLAHTFDATNITLDKDFWRDLAFDWA